VDETLRRQLVEFRRERDQVLAAHVGIFAGDSKPERLQVEMTTVSAAPGRRASAHTADSRPRLQKSSRSRSHGGGTVTGANQKKVPENLPPIGFSCQWPFKTPRRRARSCSF
jgi:hypothetical protein